MSDPDRSEEAVFEAALQLRATERAAYLEQACAGDARLRQRVESLLGALERAGGRLSVPAVARSEATVVLPLSPTAKPGDRIGRYKLLQQIGEGGCGVVYMAEQEEPVRRKVALKVIKLGMDTREVVARFEAERQALALMDHPNIAKILDGGVVGGEMSEVRGEKVRGGASFAPRPSNLSGRPYFVMELVRGIRITDFCDQNHLGLQERLELFMQVCHAVQHAHQKGIIHRDLKPSNILVTINDGVPVPKVIDFGIAKATQQKLTEKTLFTAFGQFLGTPAYMSPEQTVMTSLDIDTRSDIYSLGVLLYELLTGKPPFDTQALMKVGLDELCRTLREVEPPRPSTRLSTLAGEALASIAKFRKTDAPKLVHHVRGDLDWIVMKCLEKDRARRYETASGLAADLQRHLSNEPVIARPPSAAYRFQKLVRRNKLAVLAAASVAIALIVGTAVATWQAVRATRAEGKQAQLRVKAEAAQQDADAKAKAERAAREESDAVTKFFTRVFASPDPIRDGRTVTVAETLDKARNRLDFDLAAQPAVRAKLQATLGSTYSALSLESNAIPLMEKAASYYRATVGPKHSASLEAMQNVALSYHAVGRRDEAIQLQEEMLALCREVHGPEHIATMAAMGTLANFYDPGKRLNEVLAIRERVLAFMRTNAGPAHSETVLAMSNLASSYAYAGRSGEALKLREEVLTIRRQADPEAPSTLIGMNNLASSYDRAGRREEALKLREEALRLQRKVNGPEHSTTLVAMINLADTYANLQRLDDALALGEEVLALQRKVNGPEHPHTLAALNNLTVYSSRAGRREQAAKLAEESLALQRKVNGPEHPQTLTTMNTAAIAYGGVGRRDEAQQILEEALALRRKVNGPEHPQTLKTMGFLAIAYRNAGRGEKEIELRKELLAIARRSGTNNFGELEPMTDLAYTHYRNKDYAPAESLYREAIQSRRRPGQARSATEIATAANLGRVLSDWAWVGRGTNASLAHTRAVEGEELLRAALTSHQRRTNTPLWRLADTQSQLGGAVFVAAITDPAGAPATRDARLAAAESLLRQGHTGLEQDRNSERDSRRDAIERLVRLYGTWDGIAPGSGQAAQAAEWKPKLAEFEQGEIGK